MVPSYATVTAGQPVAIISTGGTCLERSEETTTAMVTNLSFGYPALVKLLSSFLDVLVQVASVTSVLTDGVGRRRSRLARGGRYVVMPPELSRRTCAHNFFWRFKQLTLSSRYVVTVGGFLDRHRAWVKSVPISAPGNNGRAN